MLEGLNLQSDERGATPVIGIVLLVAITIVLAAVIAQAVFGISVLGRETGPNVVFETEYDEGAAELTVTHESGNDLEMEYVSVVESGSSPSASIDFSQPSVGSSGTLSSGDNLVIENVAVGDTIRLVYESPETDRGYVVFKTTIES